MHLTNYSLPFTEEEARGLWFAVIKPFQDNMSSRGQFAIIEMDASDIPFDGVEMGPIIGKGSFGSVFKATRSGRLVAIKVMLIILLLFTYCYYYYLSNLLSYFSLRNISSK